MSDTTTDDLSVQNISEEGAIPSSRIQSADAARTILAQLIEHDRLADSKRAIIQGLIDGNPPYSDSDAEELGLNSNVNWNLVGNEIEEACIPYFDMLTSVPNYATVTATQGDTYQRERWGRLLTETFNNELLKKNKSFLVQAQLHQKSLVTFGPGFQYFKTPTDFKSFSVPVSNIKLPPNTPIDLAEWDFCFILDDITTTELYKRIINEEVASTNGWSVANTKQAIMDASNNDSANDSNKRSWEFYQTELRNNSLFHSVVGSKTIKWTHLLIKEFNGKISHYIFDREGETEWLFVSQGVYEDFRQVITLFSNGVGNGYIQGLRALGKLLYPYGEAMNRLNNSILEGAIASASILFQPENSTDLTKLEAIKVGPWQLLPPGLKAIQFNTGANIGSTTNVAGFFQNQQQGVAGGWRPTLQYDPSKRNTNKEIEAAQINRDILTNNKSEIYMQSWDLHYSEIYRRATNLNILEEDIGGKEIRSFQQKCRDLGIPEAVMKTATVKATRSIGQGSASARISLLQNGIGQFISMLPEDKRNNVITDTIAAIGGEQAVQRYAPVPNEEPTGSDMSIAALENSAFLTGGQVVLDRNQNHFIHASMHLQFAGQLVSSYQQGQRSATEVYQVLQALGPHLLLHLDYIQKDPTRKNQYNQLNRQTAELMKVTDQLAGLAQEEQEQAQNQQQQQTDPELAKVQGELAIQAQESQAKMQMKQVETEQRMALRDAKAAQDITLQNAKNQT